MTTLLDTQSRNKLWQHYRQNKVEKKLDPNLIRNLKSGWLFPYVAKIESLFWGRWQYLLECQLIPDNIWTAWQMQILATGKKNIPDYVIENTLPDRPIPQIEWQQDQEAIKMIENCLNLIPKYGDCRTISSQKYLEYFLDWLLFGLGHPGYQKEPKEPSDCKGASMRLYQYFDVAYLLANPYDYFGLIIPELIGKWTRQKTGFFPTPMPVCQMISTIITPETLTKIDRIKATYEPCVGTGGLLLVHSNKSLQAIGQDINPLLLKASLIQFALYAPWYYQPIWWLAETDLILGNTLTLESMESINYKYWIQQYQDIVKVEKVIQEEKEIIHSKINNTLKVEKEKEKIASPIVENIMKKKTGKQEIVQLTLFDLDF